VASLEKVRVQLFATCLGDLVVPEAVEAADALLREAGHEVVFPQDQICCGQPAFNAGHRRAAARVARSFTRAFSRDLPVVVPSGSCAAMLVHHMPELLGVEPYDVHELSSFLAGSPLAPQNEGRRIAYHDSCHMLRELRIHDEPRALLEASGAEIVPLTRPDLCCGFGGTFSVRQPEISVSMADDKLADAGRTAADALVTADPGCLMHLRARSERTNGPRVLHLATALARGVDQ
jgi:L-lactate dehydrogenase complex protein LldE